MRADSAVAILAALAELKGEMRQLRAELAQQRVRDKTSRQVRAERRIGWYRELVEAFGYGPTMSSCKLVALVLKGELAPPAGAERAASELKRCEAAASPRHIYRLLFEGDDVNDN